MGFGVSWSLGSMKTPAMVKSVDAVKPALDVSLTQECPLWPAAAIFDGGASENPGGGAIQYPIGGVLVVVAVPSTSR